ncbi:MAG: hypothetical protein EBS17_07090, partial [Flavobacteriia bacterium]|nr:hypothetical protein [Flavobacteriia bacterium]
MALQRDDRINYVNIGLMVITAVLAFALPFETFLFAYAFLGPLHYLTEISWLHDRQYFSKGKYDFVVLLVIGVLLSFAAFANDFGYDWEIYNQFVELNLFDKLLVFALFSAVLFALVKNVFVKILSCLLLFVFVSGWLSKDNEAANQNSTAIFALTSLVPTLIHVYVFTGLFMLYGALKSRSKSGLWQIVAFVLMPLVLVFFIPVNSQQSAPSDYGKRAYYADGNGFHNTNLSIMSHFKLIPEVTNKDYVDYILKDPNYIPDSIKYAFVLDKLFTGKTYTIPGKDSIVSYRLNGPKYQDLDWSLTNPVIKPQQALLDSLFPLEKKKYIDAQAAPFLARKNEVFLVENPESPFYMQPLTLAQLIPSSHPAIYQWIYYSNIGIMLMRFIAFAYLYHYLNWFSKTEIIQWHKVPKVRFIAVIVLWLAACGFYLYDYGLGLSVLFFLSFTHVLLEFPLNIVSIVG